MNLSEYFTYLCTYFAFLGTFSVVAVLQQEAWVALIGHVVFILVFSLRVWGGAV